MDDSRIVDLYLQRDERAIRESADKYGKALKKIAMNIIAERESAEECENDTYLKAWQSIPPNEPRSYLFAFLARIIRFTAINRARKKERELQKTVLVELDEEMEACLPSRVSVEEEIDARELSAAVSSFLRGLEEEKRNFFIRRYFFLDPLKDIAAFYGVTESKVRSSLFRVRKDLKEYLEQEGYE